MDEQSGQMDGRLGKVDERLIQVDGRPGKVDGWLIQVDGGIREEGRTTRAGG